MTRVGVRAKGLGRGSRVIIEYYNNNNEARVRVKGLRRRSMVAEKMTTPRCTLHN